jgi:hypothetical protein
MVRRFSDSIQGAKTINLLEVQRDAGFTGFPWISVGWNRKRSLLKSERKLVQEAKGERKKANEVDGRKAKEFIRHKEVTKTKKEFMTEVTTENIKNIRKSQYRHKLM